MSIHADETTDCVIIRAQLSIFIRHVYENKRCQRFLGLDSISDVKSATRLADLIAIALNSSSDAKDKLTRQTDVGAAVTTGKLN